MLRGWVIVQRPDRIAESWRVRRSAVAIFAEVGGSPDQLEPGTWMLERW